VQECFASLCGRELREGRERGGGGKKGKRERKGNPANFLELPIAFLSFPTLAVRPQVYAVRRWGRGARYPRSEEGRREGGKEGKEKKKGGVRDRHLILLPPRRAAFCFCCAITEKGKKGERRKERGLYLLFYSTQSPTERKGRGKKKTSYGLPPVRPPSLTAPRLVRSPERG